MPEPKRIHAGKNKVNYLKLNKLKLTKLYNYCFFQVKEPPGDFLTDGAHLIPRPSDWRPELTFCRPPLEGNLPAIELIFAMAGKASSDQCANLLIADDSSRDYRAYQIINKIGGVKENSLRPPDDSR